MVHTTYLQLYWFMAQTLIVYNVVDITIACKFLGPNCLASFPALPHTIHENGRGEGKMEEAWEQGSKCPHKVFRSGTSLHLKQEEFHCICTIYKAAHSARCESNVCYYCSLSLLWSLCSRRRNRLPRSTRRRWRG